MMPVARALGFVLLLSTVASAAGSVDGAWYGRSASDDANGPFFQLALTTDGATLTGTVTKDVTRYTIENGTAVNGTVVFDAVQPVDGGTPIFGLSCTGTASDDGIDLTCQIAGGGAKTYALKRLIGG